MRSPTVRLENVKLMPLVFFSNVMFVSNLQMSVAEQPCYTLISTPDSDFPSQDQLLKELETGDAKAKIEALKKVIYIILNGDKLPKILMTVVKFVLPLQDHNIKKLLLTFWEIIPKTTPDGKPLPEMILVCDAYRRDLQHPNEFIRGSTLRFLCKLKVRVFIILNNDL